MKLRKVMFSVVCLSVCLSTAGSTCDHYPWCIGPHFTATPHLPPTPSLNIRHGKPLALISTPLPRHQTWGTGHPPQPWPWPCPRHGRKDQPAPTSDIWWQSLVTWWNLFTCSLEELPYPFLLTVTDIWWHGHCSTYVWQDGSTYPTKMLSFSLWKWLVVATWSVEGLIVHRTQFNKTVLWNRDHKPHTKVFH